MKIDIGKLGSLRLASSLMQLHTGRVLFLLMVAVGLNGTANQKEIEGKEVNQMKRFYIET